jgi:hypothetical protein
MIPKDIENQHGFESVMDLISENEPEYKTDPKRINASADAIKAMRKEKLIQDVQAFEAMCKTKPEKPPRPLSFEI